MGMFLRRGKMPEKKAPVTISGKFSSSYAYARINGVRYLSDAALKLAPGTVIELYVNATSSSLKDSAKISLNGTQVSAGDEIYDFTVLGAYSSVEIVFRRGDWEDSDGDDVTVYTCSITTT